MANKTESVRPAISVDAREQRMCGLAMDLVEQRLREGTATSQETTHFLKLATSRANLEREILEANRDLTKAKVDSLKRTEHDEEWYERVYNALRSYRGDDDADGSEDIY